MAFRVGFAQTLPRFADVEGNVERAVALLETGHADLWVLPELFSTGYRFRDRAEATSLSETAGGPTVRRLSGWAASRGCHIVAGFAEKDGERLYNSSVLVGPRGLVGTYRKAHLFQRENEIFDRGPAAPPVFDIGSARVGILICFDWAFPEAARVLALRGADIVAHPSNLVLPHCQRAMVTRAIENRLFFVTANRVGREERDGEALTFTGGSQVIGPSGELLASAPNEGESVVAVDVDPRESRDKHIDPMDDLFERRRPELYQDITRG